MSPRNRALAALFSAPLLLGVAACGAGRDSQTYQERTAADATNASVGSMFVANVRIAPPLVGNTFEAGGSALAELVLVSSDDQPDTLVEASSPAAGEVVQLVGGKVGQVRVPAQGSTGGAAKLLLRDLTAPLSAGQTVSMTLRFARAGTVELAVPVGLTGTTDRPILTEGEDGSPALQGPAGGHKEGDEAAKGGAAPGGGEPPNGNSDGAISGG